MAALRGRSRRSSRGPSVICTSRSFGVNWTISSRSPSVLVRLADEGRQRIKGDWHEGLLLALCSASSVDCRRSRSFNERRKYWHITHLVTHYYARRRHLGFGYWTPDCPGVIPLPALSKFPLYQQSLPSSRFTALPN